MPAKLPLRPNVCMLVYSHSKKLFLGERASNPGVWQFPQGGVEAKFTLEENVLRELNEELGADEANFRIEKKLEATHHYDFVKPPKYAIGKWRGQTQTFWLVEFLGEDNQIVLDNHKPEFMSWRWCSPSEVRKLAEPKRLPGYEQPLSEFETFIRGRSPICGKTP